MATVAPRFQNFMQGEEPCAAQAVQTSVKDSMPKYVAKMGKSAAQFIQDVGANMGKSAAASIVSGLVVAGLASMALPAAPAVASVLASGFAARAMEGVVETSIDNMTSRYKPRAPTPSR